MGNSHIGAVVFLFKKSF